MPHAHSDLDNHPQSPHKRLTLILAGVVILAVAWLSGWIHLVKYSSVNNPPDYSHIGMLPYDFQDFHALQVTEQHQTGYSSNLLRTRYIWERGYHKPGYPRLGWSIYFGPLKKPWRPDR